MALAWAGVSLDDSEIDEAYANVPPTRRCVIV
jgi:hypothetical protein